MKHHNLLLIVYFVALSVVIGLLSALGIKPDMQTVITSMAIAALALAVLWLISKAIKRKMSSLGYSRKQWAAVMLGVDSEIVDAMPSEPPRALVPQGTLSLVPYESYDDNEVGEDDLPDAILEPDGLPFAETFRPSIHSILGQMVAIFGIRRAGKSNGLSVILEALGPYQLPMLICDTKDEYAGLVDHRYLPHGYMAGAPGATANVPEDVRFYYVPVDEAHAFAFGKSIMEGHLQVVLNLKSYEDDDVAGRVMCEIIGGINAWEEALPNKDRIPVEIVLDEAHKWLPQNESSEISKYTQARLHKTFFSTVVRMGGSNGFGLIVASQRISEIDKRCLQSAWQFLFKQTEDIDIKRYEVKGIPREQVLSLRQGECFVFCPLALGFRVQMYAKKSPDLSTTPGLAQLAKHRPVAHAKHEMLARKHSYTGEDDEQEDESSSELTGELQTAWDWYCKGYRSGRKMAGAMDITPDRAFKLIAKLQSLGYAEKSETPV
jgi:hypothetical protein